VDHDDDPNVYYGNYCCPGLAIDPLIDDL